MSDYSIYENKKYVTKFFTDEDREYFKIGYNYFNSLDKKRSCLTIYNDKNCITSYGLMSVEEYDKLPRGKQLQLEYGFKQAIKEYIDKHSEDFFKEIDCICKKYKAEIFNDGTYRLEIDGENFFI